MQKKDFFINLKDRYEKLSEKDKKKFEKAVEYIFECFIIFEDNNKVIKKHP